MESVDFAKAPEESRKKINSWVESQTNGRRAAHCRHTFEKPMRVSPVPDTAWGPAVGIEMALQGRQKKALQIKRFSK